MLDRALEIATDFIDAAGPHHPMVDPMIRANDDATGRITGSGISSDSWRSSAVSLFEAASLHPDHPVTHERLGSLVPELVELSRSLDMPWTPPPALARAAGLQ